MERQYIAIDLKSFYASVECVERGLDPLCTNLVVADESRTDKTICLAVSPSLKSYGIPGRPRLFEVIRKVREVNRARKSALPGGRFSGESCDDKALKNDPSLAVSYITAVPRMAYYVEYSTKIYRVYLKYIAPEDMHVYSIDEVFIDATHYLRTYGMTARELAMTIIRDILETTGITATAGIGTNLYLCKIAMDIEAKHVEPDENGVRIAELDEMSYRKKLWDHTPMTDFWRIGRGYAGKLASVGLYTMGDVARCSLGKKGEYYNEDLLYDLFGVNAELLIDHAWGWEPVGIEDIKQYKPAAKSISSGQVLPTPYPADKARTVTWEMADLLSLDLVEKGLVTDTLVLTVGYDSENLADPERARQYKGEVTADRYGRKVPKHAHGTIHLARPTASTRLLLDAATELFDRITDKRLLVRRLTIAAEHVVPEGDAMPEAAYEQLDLFTDYEALEKEKEEENAALEREKRLQQALLDIKKKYGKNAVLRGTNLEEGATARSRNEQIGGHRA